MTSKMRLVAANVCLALGSALAVDLAMGAVVDASPQSAERLVELDEVWVHGKSLAERIEAAEDDFFALYNELNTRRRFDVRCGVTSLHRDSMIMVRKCVPEFRISYASSSYVSNPIFRIATCIGNSIYSESSWNNQFYSCINSAGREVLVSYGSPENQAEYASHVLKVINGDPRLLEQAGKLAVLYDELELTQKRYVDLKPARKTSPPRTNPRAL